MHTQVRSCRISRENKRAESAGVGEEKRKKRDVSSHKNIPKKKKKWNVKVVNRKKKISLLVFLLLLLDTFRCSLEGKVETIEACCWLRVEKSVFEISQKVSAVWSVVMFGAFSLDTKFGRNTLPPRVGTHTHTNTERRPDKTESISNAHTYTITESFNPIYNHHQVDFLPPRCRTKAIRLGPA